MMPEKKPKNEPVKQNIEQPKPQVKLQKASPVKEKDTKPQTQQTTLQNKCGNNNVSTKPDANVHKGNKNLNVPSNAQNRSVSMSLAGTESEYGIITPETKKCKPTDKTQIGKLDNLEITVSNPEKKEVGFLKKTHVTYLFTTLPLNFKVRRRFSDVSWFRQALLNLYPVDLIPAVPRKTRFGQ